MAVTTAGFKPKLWVPGDWNAFFGFGTNILVNMLCAHRPAALRAQDARRAGVRPHPARHRPDAVPQHHVLRLAGLSPRQGDRPHRRLRPALGHQRAAHVRRRVRDHAADPDHHQGSRAGLGSRPHLGVRAELRADGRRLHRALHPQDHATRRPAGLAGRHLDHLHLDAAGRPDGDDADHRPGLLCRHHGRLVRRRALLQGRAGRPGGHHRRRHHRLGLDLPRLQLWRPDLRGAEGRRLELRLFLPHAGCRPRLRRLPVHRHHPGDGDPVRHLRPRRGDGQCRERRRRRRFLPDDQGADRRRASSA